MGANIRRALSAVLLAAIWLSVAESSASEATHETEHEAEHEEKYALGLFVGSTEVDGEWENTLGLEFTYHINHRWSTFALLERSERNQDTTLGMIGMGYYPYKGLVLVAGIGKKDPEEARENVARLAVAYGFELEGGWELEPYAGVDFIENHDDNEHVLGVVFAKRF